MTVSQTGCCVVGGGPAGLFLAYFLARQGIDTTLLEAHRDFDRDFRGDTVHSSTMEVLDQVGMVEEVLALPHAKMHEMYFNLGPEMKRMKILDLRRLKSKFPYITMMPQVHLLDFMYRKALEFPNFHGQMGARVRSLVREGERIACVRYVQDKEEHEVRAAVTVACDGRFSPIRKMAGLEPVEESLPVDIFWLRMPRRPEDKDSYTGLCVNAGQVVSVLQRPDEWQLGYVLPKGDIAAVRDRGLAEFKATLGRTLPWLGDRVEKIQTWGDAHLLTIKANCLERWYLPGLLFLGDAAHTMSPFGGVGINAAISDAIEAVNVLSRPLLAGAVREEHLAEVEHRRYKSTKRTQALQHRIHKNLLRQDPEKGFEVPLMMKIIMSTPFLRDIPPKRFTLGNRVLIENPGAFQLGAPPPARS
jgi:2-polyprenyl-6-methoxyphenol hydroxylase-like FAD-dependent oxidoreductase